MRPGNRSRTSDWVAALRALYTEAPPELAVFDDAIALRLIPTSLRLLVNGAARIPFGTRVVHRAIGTLTRGLSYGVPLRTVAIDEAVQRAVLEGVRQLVLLGAGLDARAWRIPELSDTIVFELDHPDTQTYKRERTRELAPLCREIRFCAINFEKDTLSDALVAHGFDPAAKSIWVWEGVTMYLSPEAIEATLQAMSGLAAPGSLLAMTYLPHAYARKWIRTVAEIGGALIGEELKSTHDPQELSKRLAAHGFAVERDDSALEWADRWPQVDARRVRSFERLAIARRGGD